MADSNLTVRTDGGGKRPDDVRGDHQAAVEYLTETDAPEATSPFRALFDPPARAAILDALLVGHPDPLTAREICDSAGITTSPFYDQVEYLQTAGVVEGVGKKGNATVFGLVTGHPVTQLLMMAKTVQTHGVTPMLLEEQFIGDPGADYDPGDHPADPR